LCIGVNDDRSGDAPYSQQSFNDNVEALVADKLDDLAKTSTKDLKGLKRVLLNAFQAEKVNNQAFKKEQVEKQTLSLMTIENAVTAVGNALRTNMTRLEKKTRDATEQLNALIDSLSLKVGELENAIGTETHILRNDLGKGIDEVRQGMLRLQTQRVGRLCVLHNVLARDNRIVLKTYK